VDRRAVARTQNHRGGGKKEGVVSVKNFGGEPRGVGGNGEGPRKKERFERGKGLRDPGKGASGDQLRGSMHESTG